MVLFEFILVMVSLILAIGVTHLLQRVVEVVRHRQTLELYWVPLAWAATLFVLAAGHWWSLWDMRGVEWTFPGFFFVLLPPTLFYVAASLLVSGDIERSGVSMVAAFDAIRQPFMVVMLALFTLVSFDGWVLGTEPVWNSLRLLQGAMIGSVFLGLVSSRRAVQQLVAAGGLLLLLLVTFVLRFLPGAFGPS